MRVRRKLRDRRPGPRRTTACWPRRRCCGGGGRGWRGGWREAGAGGAEAAGPAAGPAQDYRMLAEAALLVERSDIEEELVRLRAHIGSFLEMLDAGGELRSEERRVGKECRSRWSPDH